jgi:hypothetical protein
VDTRRREAFGDSYAKVPFRMSAAGGMALAGWRGIAMGPVVDCNICRNFGNIGDYYVYNRVLLE